MQVLKVKLCSTSKPGKRTTWFPFKVSHLKFNNSAKFQMQIIINQAKIVTQQIHINISWVYLYFNHHVNQFNRQPTEKGLKGCSLCSVKCKIRSLCRNRLTTRILPGKQVLGNTILKNIHIHCPTLLFLYHDI